MPRKSEHVLRPNHLVIAAAVTRAGEERSEWRIAGIPGLVLRCLATGSASWWFVYRFHGRVKRFKIGERDAVSFADAKRQAQELAGDVAGGADPAADKATTARLERGLTFRELYERRMQSADDLRPSSRDFYRACIEGTVEGHQSVMKLMGNLEIAKLTPQDVIAVINKVELRRSLTAHDQARAAVSAILGWGVKRGLLPLNPAAAVPRRSKAVPRESKASEADLATLWRALQTDALALTTEMRIIIQLTLLTAQRRAEIAGARIAELDLSGPEPVWCLPGDIVQRGRNARVIQGRTKNGREHTVPLSTQAAALWQQALDVRAKHAWAQQARDAERRLCVFPSQLVEKSRCPHIHAQSVTQALARSTKDLGIADITPHDLRRTFATWAGDNGIPYEVVGRILNHTPTDVTRRHYMQSRLDGPARTALQKWADYLSSLGPAG